MILNLEAYEWSVPLGGGMFIANRTSISRHLPGKPEVTICIYNTMAFFSLILLSLHIHKDNFTTYPVKIS